MRFKQFNLEEKLNIMFGRKNVLMKKKFLAILNYLLDEDETVTAPERKYLLKAKNEIENDVYYPRIMNELTYVLLPLALHGKLYKNVRELYSRAMHDSHQDQEWNGISFMSF